MMEFIYEQLLLGIFIISYVTRARPCQECIPIYLTERHAMLNKYRKLLSPLSKNRRHSGNAYRVPIMVVTPNPINIRM